MRAMARRTYAGVSAELRREQRLTTLLDAALEIIGTRGFAALTVAGLCSQAGLNERYYYEHFTKREDVLAALVVRTAAELVAAMGAAATAATPRTPRAIVHAGLTAAVEMHTNDPRKARAFFIEAPTNSELARRRAQIIRPFITLMLEPVAEHYGADTARQTADQAIFTGTFLFGGIAETVTGWLRGDLAISHDELVNNATDLFIHLADHRYGRPAGPGSTT